MRVASGAEPLIDKRLEASMLWQGECQWQRPTPGRKQAANCAGQCGDSNRALQRSQWIGDLENVLKAQTNSKKITMLSLGQNPDMNLKMTPVYKKIGPVFKGNAQKVVAALNAADPFKVKEQLASGSCPLSHDGQEYPITSEMVEFAEITPEGLSAAEFSKGTVYVDTKLTMISWLKAMPARS